MEIIILISASFVQGLLLYIANLITNKSFLKNIHHFLTFCMLPTITLIITKSISGNIALALGMVGALSIVRFRNPVRSPYELTMYFLLITLGITTSVNIFYSFALFGFAITVIISTHILQKFDFINLNSNNLFGDFKDNNNSIIVISSNKEIDGIKKEKIIDFSYENQCWNYSIEVSEKNKFTVLKEYKEIDSIKSIKIV